VVRARKDRNAPVQPYGALSIHLHEPARQRARELANTPEFANAQRQRKKVEALLAEPKNQIEIFDKQRRYGVLRLNVIPH